MLPHDGKFCFLFSFASLSLSSLPFSPFVVPFFSKFEKKKEKKLNVYEKPHTKFDFFFLLGEKQRLTHK